MARSNWIIPGKRCGNRTTEFLFEYETPRVVTVRSYRVGLTYRIVQLLILAYLIGYVFIYTKSYQDFEVAEYSVVTKIKGVLIRNSSGYSEVWDAVDFVIPPQESGAFFIATSILYTANQSQSECAEDANVGKAGVICSTDKDCTPNEATPYGNGIRTGRCVPRHHNISTCEIKGWCQTEIDSTPKVPVLSGFETLTVLVKHHVSFPKYDVKRRNIPENKDQSYLRNCRFHPDKDPLCPIFVITDIVRLANESMQDMAMIGGIIGFNIAWDCNLDLNIDKCVPHYSFRRLDDKEDKIAKGWNFRHAYYHYGAGDKLRRDLVKLWGIRFVFNVNGRAGKISYVNFAMNLGSGLGLLGIASIVCEFVLLNCMTPKTELLEQKFTKLAHDHDRHVAHRDFCPSRAGSQQLNPSYLDNNHENFRNAYGNPELLRPPLATWDDGV